MAEMDDPMLKCPYDDSHSILRSRMQFHLVRCSKNHVGSQKLQCPFNTLHIIDPLEFDYHLSVCETGASIMTQKFTLGSEPKTEMTPVVSIQSQSSAPMTENWDEDSAPVASYDPEHHIETRNITRMLIGASKAKKKQFRQAERLRMQALSEISASAPVRKPAIINKGTEKSLRSPRSQRKVLADSKPNVGLDNIDMSKLSISETSTTRNSKPNMGLDSIDISKLLISDTSAIDNKKKISSKSSKNVTKDEHSTSKVTSDQSNVKLEGIISDSVQKSDFNNASTKTTTSIIPQMQLQVKTEINSALQSDTNFKENESCTIENIKECLSDASSTSTEPLVTTKIITSCSEDEIESSTLKSSELKNDVLSSTLKDSLTNDFNDVQNLKRAEQKEQVPCFEKSDEANSSKIPNSKEDDLFNDITSRLNSLSTLAKFYADEKAKLDQKITEYVSSTPNSSLTDVLRKVSLMSASSCNNPPTESQTNVSGVNRRCAANFCKPEPDLTKPSAGRGITKAYTISRPGVESTYSDFQRQANASQEKIKNDMKYTDNFDVSALEKSGRKYVGKNASLKNCVSTTDDPLYEVKENLTINANSNDDTVYEASSVNNSATLDWSQVLSQKYRSTNAS